MTQAEELIKYFEDEGGAAVQSAPGTSSASDLGKLPTAGLKKPIKKVMSHERFRV